METIQQTIQKLRDINTPVPFYCVSDSSVKKKIGTILLLLSEKLDKLQVGNEEGASQKDAYLIELDIIQEKLGWTRQLALNKLFKLSLKELQVFASGKMYLISFHKKDCLTYHLNFRLCFVTY
jgi:hypothetical protein